MVKPEYDEYSSANCNPNQPIQRQQYAPVSNLNTSINSANSTSNSNSNTKSTAVLAAAAGTANQTGIAPQNQSKYMQDFNLNNNYNLYHAINPLDINRNYQQQQQLQSHSYTTSNNNSTATLQLPTLLANSTPTGKTNSTSYAPQIKRGNYNNNKVHIKK